MNVGDEQQPGAASSGRRDRLDRVDDRRVLLVPAIDQAVAELEQGAEPILGAQLAVLLPDPLAPGVDGHVAVADLTQLVDLDVGRQVAFVVRPRPIHDRLDPAKRAAPCPAPRPRGGAARRRCRGRAR